MARKERQRSTLKGRDAGTGRFISVEQARKRPNTTVVERVPLPGKAKEKETVGHLPGRAWDVRELLASSVGTEGSVMIADCEHECDKWRDRCCACRDADPDDHCHACKTRNAPWHGETVGKACRVTKKTMEPPWCLPCGHFCDLMGQQCCIDLGRDPSTWCSVCVIALGQCP